MNRQTAEGLKGPIGWMASNPVAANLLFVFVIVSGLFGISLIDKEVFPSFPSETMTITVPYPGSSPEEVERGIILRVEEAIRDIVGIKEVRSEARESVGIVTVQMEPGSDMTKALNQAKVRVDGISSFPLDAEKPIVEEVKSFSPAMRVSLYGDVDLRKLKEISEEVREEMLALGGVSEISVIGERDYEISIELSDAKLRNYGLSFDQVVSAVRNRSRDLPGGTLRTDEGSITLRSVSQAYSGEEFAELTLLSRPDGTRIKLGDVADVRDRFAEQPVLSLFNGKPGITFVVDRVGEQNVLGISATLREYVSAKQAQLPPEIRIEGWYDRSEILKGRIELMLRNAVQGAFLVIVALALFLNLTLAFWVVAGIPFAVLGCIATIVALDLPVSINVLSVFGFILVLGLLVDDAIVTAESAFSQLEADNQGVNSIVKGVHRVSIATIFGALTTVVAFSPTLLVEEGFSRVLVHLGPVVMLCLVFSLIETKLVLPSHLRHIRVNQKSSVGLIGRFETIQAKFSDRLKDFARGPYRRTLATAVKHRYITVAIFMAALVICLSLIPAGVVRTVFFPTVPSDLIRINLNMPQGSAWQKTHDYALRVEQAAMNMSQRFADQDKQGRQVIRQIMVMSGSDINAKVDIQLIPSEDRDIDSVELGKWLREELGPLEGIRSFSLDAQAGPGGLPVDVQLKGKNLDQLRMAAQELKVVLAGVDGVRDIRDSFNAGGREMAISVTPEGEALGLGDVELARQVRQAFFGAEVQRVQRGRDEVRVYVRLPRDERSSLEALRSLWINLPDGRRVPFPVVGKMTEQAGVSVINRIDFERVVDVQADIDKRQITSTEVAELLERQLLPDILARHPSVRYHMGGEVEDTRDTESGLFFGLIVILVMIYAALAIPLKNYLEPLLIMSVIPFGVTGAILGHLILGMDVSVLSFFGILGLIGVVVNDSLVLVDFINHYIDEGKEWPDAVMEAGPARFRAVLLTSVTTFMGLLPIQLETSIQAQFVKPMATSVAFGVLFATVVTLFLVPTLYYISRDILGVIRKGQAELKPLLD
ncbi:MAG: efflux RND transporter permease subunit [bacterium]